MIHKEAENWKIILKKQHYVVVGNHSAVQVCRWTKKSLRDEGFCYKEKFYGIKSHGCCQMNPYLACQNSCVHCWRPIDLDYGLKLKEKIKEIDSAKKIIEGCILAQRKLLSGFKGYSKINKRKWIQAQNLTQFAISLKLLKFLPKYKFLDEQEVSRVVLLGKDKRKMRIKKSEV